MNWEEVGAIGQVLGSIAVFVTLGYLAVQVRPARRQVQRVATDNREATARQLMLTQVTDERLSKLLEKVAPPFHRSCGSSIERMSFPTSTTCLWGDRAFFDSSLRLAYQTLPASRFWYQQSRALMNPDAVRYIDKLLAQPS